MTAQTILEFKSIDFAFGNNKIFTNLSIKIDTDNPVIILGSSGCGKTTFLNLAAGLLKPDKGEIISNFDSISMVFQEPRLLPWKTVVENVSLPLIRSMEKKKALEKASYFLNLVSLGEKAKACPDELSGGQKQRVNLARAFACPGDLLLMDEPFQSLDIPLRLELMDLTNELIEVSAKENQNNPILLIVTHDPREAVYMGKRILILGKKPDGIIFDEKIDLMSEDRVYGSAANAKMELKLLGYLTTKRRG